MIQLIASLIEWLAILALSTIGIEYNPDPCNPAEPTEYRVIAIAHTGEASAAAYRPAGGDGCGAGEIHRSGEDVFFLPPTPVHYDS